MDIATAVVIIISIIMTSGCGLGGLWLRLHYGVRYEQARGQNVSRVAEVIGQDGHLDLEEQRGNAHHLRMKITHARARGENRAQ